MRLRAMSIALSCLAALGCEKPRERACRSLVIQARNAEDARATPSVDARVAASRARSAARWLRSNAVDDAELRRDVAALADALERLADTRLRLADAADALGATDAADLLARAERIDAYLATTDEVPKIRRKECPWYREHELIEDPRCTAYMVTPECHFDVPTLAAHAARCVAVVEGVIDVAVAPSDVSDLANRLRAHAEWAKTLPARPIKETVDRARAVTLSIADRGRADAEVAAHVRSLEEKCAH